MRKHLTSVIFIAVCAVLIISCKKDDAPAPTPTPIAAKSFINVTFNPTTAAYFSTNGTMTAPVDSNQAMTISNRIDITFIFDYSYTEPGFFDPKARSQVWYWNDYYKPWLSNAVETRFYSTTLTKTQFDEAKADETKIATDFSASSVVLAPHAIFPTGSCIGGRVSSGPTSLTLSQGQVYAFKNTVSGKRGLLYIRTDQYANWPIPISNTNTKVDIIREN